MEVNGKVVVISLRSVLSSPCFARRLSPLAAYPQDPRYLCYHTTNNSTTNSAILIEICPFHVHFPLQMHTLKGIHSRSICGAVVFDEVTGARGPHDTQQEQPAVRRCRSSCLHVIRGQVVLRTSPPASDNTCEILLLGHRVISDFIFLFHGSFGIFLARVSSAVQRLRPISYHYEFFLPCQCALRTGLQKVSRVTHIESCEGSIRIQLLTTKESIAYSSDNIGTRLCNPYSQDRLKALFASTDL